MGNSGAGLVLERVSCPVCGDDRSRPVTGGYDYEYATTPGEFFLVECLACGLVYLNPRPTIESAPVIYPSDYYTFAGRHERRGLGLVHFFKQMVVRRRIPAEAAALRGQAFRILEVGCGDCALLLELRKRYPMAECTGLDLRFTGLQRAECAARGIALITSPVEDAPMEENRYDLVIMNQLIEHAWRPVDVLRKIARALREGGRLTISTVDLDGYDRRFFRAHYWGGYYFPRHLSLFTGETLRRALEKAGLAVETRRSLVAPVVWIFSLHAWLSSSRLRALKFPGRFMTDRNPALLALFTMVDLLALAAGLTTSNQQVIAVKACPPAGGSGNP